METKELYILPNQEPEVLEKEEILRNLSFHQYLCHVFPPFIITLTPRSLGTVYIPPRRWPWKATPLWG